MPLSSCRAWEFVTGTGVNTFASSDFANDFYLDLTNNTHKISI